MLRNYVITAFRSLYRNKGFSFINILGLTIGLASFMLIGLYVFHELSFDRFHTKSNRIYRVVENLRTENELLFQSTSAPPMGPMLFKEFPEVENYVRFTGNSRLVKRGNLAFFEENCLLADSSIFSIFSFKLLKGNPKTALVEPKSVVLTEASAKKYFGEQDAFGETLEMGGQQFKVTGIVENMPDNSHFDFDFLLSFSTWWSAEYKEYEMSYWYWNGFHTYLLLKKGTSVDQLNSKMKGFIDKHIPKGGMYYETLPLQPLSSIYLEKPRTWENGKRGSLNNLYILSAIALFTLMIAAFNYINLATARASRRLKEVGLRKVLGAQRRTLVAQFLGESILLSLLATSLAFGFAMMMLPPFNDLVESNLSFSVVPMNYLLGSLISLVILLGLLSGLYPALMISGFQPLQIFRPAVHGMMSHSFFRKVLVSAQFIISIGLVAGTLLVFDQLSMVKNIDLGFTREAVIVTNFNYQNEIRLHAESVKNELHKINGVDAVTISNTVPGESTNNLYGEFELQDGKMSPTNINSNFIDHDYLPAFGIQLIAGRNFSREFLADDTTAFIVNETAMKTFGWTTESAVGKKVNHNGRQGTIIGVVKDYHYRSLHHHIEPLLLAVDHWSFTKVAMKIRSDDVPGVIGRIEAKWKTISSGLPFRYSFLDQDYDRLYKSDMQLGKVAGVFSGLAIFVGCLGLLGLTAFSVERRVKEIGIRKVLGASAGNVVLLISKEFMWLIAISFVIAVPLTYYLVSRWLQNFTDRISIGPVTFLIAGICVMSIAWITISFLSFKAASTNPTKALRTE
jgi:putative ABC transport system permease protein